MSTTVFVYKRAGEDTEYDLNIDSAALALTGSTLKLQQHQRNQDQACYNRQDSWEEIILGLLHAPSVQLTAKLHFWIQHSQF